MPSSGAWKAIEGPDPAPLKDAGSLTSDRFFLLLAIFIGVLSGLAVVAFRMAIVWSRHELLGESPTGLRLILVPTLVSLVIAALVIWLFPRARGSGVNQTKAALYIYDGYIPFRTAIGKFITAALAIGCGHSLGPEDPSLQIGATIASTLGRRLQLSRDKLRLIAPVGAAAGLSAAFNAPISAVLFVIEEVIGRWSAGVLGAVVLAAVSSVVVARQFLGAGPLFQIPAVEFVQPKELIAYSVLGVIGGLASVVFARSIELIRPALKRLPRWTQYFQPALAGLMIGVIAYLGAPQVMGAGYETISYAMHDRFTWQLLGALAGIKLLATTLSFSSGTPGGMFAPTLFIGAMLGGAVGGFERELYPHLTGSMAAYALVGMGVLFAGFLRAPFTSVFMVLEVSGDYSIIIPVILANTIAYLISRLLQPVPIFDLLTRQDGLELPSMEEEREGVVLRVEDAMRPNPAPVLEEGELLSQTLPKLDGVDCSVVLVRLSPKGWSSTTPGQMRKANENGHAGSTLREALSLEPMPHVFPDQPLESALRRVYKWRLLPVVHRADFRKLLGVISLGSILRQYRIATEQDATPEEDRETV